MSRSIRWPLLALLSACGVPGGSPTSPPPAVTSEEVARLAGLSNEGRYFALVEMLRERSIPFEVDEFSIGPAATELRLVGRNVVVTFGTGSRDLVVGAHYDAAAVPGGGLSPGAVDNASGVVALVHLATTLRGIPTRHRVRIVFFDLEEIGGRGSRRYVSEAEPGRTSAMVNLDIAGYGRTIMFGPAASPGNETTYQAAWSVCRETGLSCLEFPAYPQSDDRSFQEVGIPNISVGVLDESEARLLWRVMNSPDFQAGEMPLPPILTTVHTLSDTAEKVDPLAVQVAQDFLLRVVLHLDGTAQ